MKTLICLLAVNVFLLTAVFGVMVARWVEGLDDEPPKNPWYVRAALGAFHMIADPTVEKCRFLDNERLRMEVTLTDGSVWEGHGKWWWNPETGHNAPGYVHRILSRSNHARTLGYETV